MNVVHVCVVHDIAAVAVVCTLVYDAPHCLTVVGVGGWWVVDGARTS